MTSQTFIDLILALVVAEAIALALLLPRRFPQIPRSGVFATLGAGGCLILALRALAHGATTLELALWLTLALAAHLLDLTLRLAAPTPGDHHG
jgi:hypothetical protein